MLLIELAETEIDQNPPDVLELIFGLKPQSSGQPGARTVEHRYCRIRAYWLAADGPFGDFEVLLSDLSFLDPCGYLR